MRAAYSTFMRYLLLLVMVVTTSVNAYSGHPYVSVTTEVVVRTTTKIRTTTVYATIKPTVATNCNTLKSAGCQPRSDSPKWTNTTFPYQTTSLTSSFTKTVTSIITPPNVTTTIFRTPFPPLHTLSATTQPSSARSSLRVTTITVYSIPAAITMNAVVTRTLEPPESTVRLADISESSVHDFSPVLPSSGKILPVGSHVAANHHEITDQPNATSTSHSSVHSPNPVSAATMKLSSSSGGRLKPNRWIIAIFRLLSVVSMTKAHATTNGMRDNGIEARFYPVHNPAQHLPPRYNSITLLVRLFGSSVPGNPTNTVTYTVTTTSTITVQPLLMNNIHVTSAPMSTDATLKPGTYSPWWSSVRNVTVVSIVTAAAAAQSSNDNMQTLTATLIIPNIVNVTKTLTSDTHVTVTMTETIPKTTPASTSPETSSLANVGTTLFANTFRGKSFSSYVLLSLALLLRLMAFSQQIS